MLLLRLNPFRMLCGSLGVTMIRRISLCISLFCIVAASGQTGGQSGTAGKKSTKTTTSKKSQTSGKKAHKPQTIGADDTDPNYDPPELTPVAPHTAQARSSGPAASPTPPFESKTRMPAHAKKAVSRSATKPTPSPTPERSPHH